MSLSSPGSWISTGARTLCLHSAAEREDGENAGDRQQQSREGEVAAKDMVSKTLVSFNPSDQVLVLLPTSASKLSAQWQGPYRIIERRGKVNYLVHMEDHKKKRRVFHVNMLRQWHPPVSAFQDQEVYNGIEEDEYTCIE
jgi:hypothetical protein